MPQHKNSISYDMQPDSVSNKNIKQQQKRKHSNETNRISSNNAHKLEFTLAQTHKI